MLSESVTTLFSFLQSIKIKKVMLKMAILGASVGAIAGYTLHNKFVLADEEGVKQLREQEKKIVKQSIQVVMNPKPIDQLKEREKKEAWNSRVLQFHKTLVDFEKTEFLNVEGVRKFFRTLINRD